MKNIPKKIYLQVGDLTDDEIKNSDFSELSEVTWCKEKVSATDIEYVRSDSDASIPEEYKRMKCLLLNLLETIADATNGASIGDYDCGTIFTPQLRYEPSFELTEDDIKTIKELAENECEDAAITLMDWINNADKD